MMKQRRRFNVCVCVVTTKEETNTALSEDLHKDSAEAGWALVDIIRPDTFLSRFQI